MSGTEPEFSHMVRLDEIGRMIWPVRIEADTRERKRLAERFAFIALDELDADYTLTREGETVLAIGKVRARLSQPCIATGEPVVESIDEDFMIRFVPEASATLAGPGEEVELDAEECDILPYEGGRIDMGEAIAETLALAVNPYPRSESADAWLRQAGVLTEEQAGPFAALAALNKKRGGKK